jgi:all-trans-retinol dehydrogenase (NAD+)
MKNLKGKTALVTGAAMGMGRSLSEQLLLEGCTLALVDVNKQALELTAQELSKLGKCSSYVCDISNREAVYKLAKQVEKELGSVSILVNNAGIVKAKALLDLEDDAIEKTININLTSMFWTCKAFLPEMVKRREGHVVNFASAGGILAIPNLSAYCASKFGVIGFTDAVRQEMNVLKSNVGFTVVCPNTVNTGMFAGSKMVAGTKMLTADEVAYKVLVAIKKNQAMVAVPSIPVKILTPLTKVMLPIKVMDWMNDMLGMAHANDTWTGRQG